MTRKLFRTVTGPVMSRYFCYVLVSLFAVEAVLATEPPPVRSGPATFEYTELTRLYETNPLPDPLATKLERLLTTPFVDNGASERGVRPKQPVVPGLGKTLRVALWNIERGLEFDAVKAAFLGGPEFTRVLDAREEALDAETRKEAIDQTAILKDSDVIVLNEVDYGLKRTGYRNVVEELARALDMNYAYGVEFVEVDPITLGIEKFEEAPPEERAQLVRENSVDKARYKGLHGTAILSRYRLENVRLVPFKYQGHDWYMDEKKAVSDVEEGKRQVSEKVFLEKIGREVRRGGRMMLLADISDPAFPDGTVTVVATHLEARTKPEGRARQLREVLTFVWRVEHPVILAGDMNTSTSDATPTSIKREVKKRLGSSDFWLKQGIKYATGVGLIFDVVSGGIGLGRTQADPTVKSIPLIARNPEAEFFEILEDFRFVDRGAFDFRGDKRRTADGRNGKLANSNERSAKGFEITYEPTRSYAGVGKFKLDWFFVKPASLTDPDDEDQSYRFAPHFGRTLKRLNDAVEEGISDHNPMTVDLPLEEPKLN